MKNRYFLFTNSITMEKMNATVWQKFVDQEALTNTESALLKQYVDLLLAWNEMHNLTRITTTEGVINDHLRDALFLKRYVNFFQAKGFADVGSGAGVPGIPLKIMFPDLFIVLIEVNKKKIAFLQEVIIALALQNIVVYEQDWRTFLRTTKYGIDYVGARASLPPQELIKMFQPSSFYRDATLVYWASQQWQMPAFCKDYFKEEYEYRIAEKIRRYIIFRA